MKNIWTTDHECSMLSWIRIVSTGNPSNIFKKTDYRVPCRTVSKLNIILKNTPEIFVKYTVRYWQECKHRSSPKNLCVLIGPKTPIRKKISISRYPNRPYQVDAEFGSSSSLQCGPGFDFLFWCGSGSACHNAKTLRYLPRYSPGMISCIVRRMV